MSLLKGFVAVAVLAAFLAGAVVANYVHPQPAAAMTAAEVKSLPVAQDQVSDAQQPRVYQTNTADYVTRARPVRYIERGPTERVVSEPSVARERVVVHRRRTLKNEALIVGGGAAAGAAIGAAAHGGRGAAVGALAGGIAGLAYDLATRNH